MVETIVTEPFARAIRYFGLAITALVVGYTALVVLGVIPSEHYSGPVVGVGMALSWFIVSLYYFIHPARTLSDQALRLGVFHAFAFALFVMVIGFAQPFTLLFVLLFVATYHYFGKNGFFISAGSFLFIAVIDMALRIQTYPSVVYDTGLMTITTLFVGWSVIALYHAREVKHSEVRRTHSRSLAEYNQALTIMNNLTDAAFSIDMNGAVKLYNAASLNLLDTNRSIKGLSMDTLFNLVDTEGKSVHISNLLHEAVRVTRRDDLSHQYPDGELVRLEITYAPIKGSYSTKKRTGEYEGYILILRDITKQKSLEEERDEFISVVSHELRTPITIVEGTLSNLQVLTSRDTLPTKKQLTQTITTAHDQVLYLAKMVNDLSTLSRAERGVADTPESIDVETLMHAMHTQYQHDATAKKLHLNLDIGPKLGSVQASRLYLEELLQNFITNALKYTKEGTVTIKAHKTNGQVVFAVIDTGIGISRSDQNKVFNKFYRSEDYRIRETGGTGLGLYVSSKLARKLHTSIVLKSRLNHGSTFSFALPAESVDPSN